MPQQDSGPNPKNVTFTKPYKNTWYLTCSIKLTTRLQSPSRMLNKWLLNLISPLTGITSDNCVAQPE